MANEKNLEDLNGLDDMDGLLAESVEVDRKPHEDQYVHYTHEMPEDTKEGAGRFVVRVVPLLYGFLVGGLMDNLLAGLAVGAAVSIGTDLAMRKGSLFRPLLRPFYLVGCPVVALIANGLARGIGLLGLTAPAVLRDRRCGAS